MATGRPAWTRKSWRRSYTTGTRRSRLKEELGKHAALLTYVQRLADEVFSTPPPPPLPQGAGVGNGGPGPDPADKATEDPEFVRQRNLWLLMAATVVGAYVLFGDVVGIDLMYEEDEDDGEGE